MNIMDSLKMEDYFDILKKRKRIVFTFFAATFIVALVVTLLMTPIYRATVMLLIDVESPHVLTTTVGVNVAQGGGDSYYAYREYFKSQANIITSHAIAEQVFSDLDLSSLKKYARAKDPVETFMKSIEIEPIPETRLLNLNVENKDPALAAKIANHIAELYTQRNLAYISSSERLTLLANEYLRLETKIAEFSKIYLPAHPEMIKLQEALNEVARQIEKEKQIAQGSITGGSDDIYLTRISYPRANNVSIITRAKVPTTPIKPKKQLNMLIAIIVGLFGGAGLAFFLEYQDMTIKTIEDIKSLTKWTVLGSVPEIKTLDRELHVLKNPNDLFSESYRASITRIFFKGEKETIKSIAISSFGPGEGKTTTACTLALLTAEKKKKVLLVDADLRKPRLSGIFSLTGQKGLGEYLSDECAIREVIQKTDIANLSVVAEKKSSLNPALLFSNEKLDQFISEAKKDFDYIIFDTPPMGALSESLILARKVDSLILVVESGKTPKKALIRNQQVLDESGINCTGLILLKTRLVGSENYYYSSKYYNKR